MFLLGLSMAYGAVIDYSNNVTACWTGDSFASDVGDYDGTAHDGTTITSTDCLIGDCWDFDGTSDVELSSYPLSNTEGTIEIWFKPDESGIFDWLIGNRDTSVPNYNAPGLFVKDDNSYVTHWVNTALDTRVVNIDGVGSVTTASYNRVLLVWNSTTSEIWDDDSRVGTSAAASDLATGIIGDGFFFGIDVAGAGINSLNGRMDEIKMWNVSLPDAEKIELYNSGSGMTCSDIQATPTFSPTFSNNARNITAPLQNTHMGFNITITASGSNTISGYIFSYDNGSETFYNTSFLDMGETFTIANATYNITIYNVSGVTWQWKWWANDSDGTWGGSSVYSLIVGGTTAPTLTLNSNNFFNADDTTYINVGQASSVLLNITLTDDIDVFGYELNISHIGTGNTAFNHTNNTLNGFVDNVSIIIDITRDYSADGLYLINITTWDSHTALSISNYDIEKGEDYLLFDNSIRITADKAKSANSKKLFDKYSFEFEYSKFFTPTTKVFYIESDGVLTYMNTKYKAHFVDWKNKKWIDFEGLEGTPIITKVNDFKYKIEFDNADEKVIFKSIGGLNSRTYLYQYYLVNPSVDWFIPTTTTAYFINNTISVILNVTSDYRNETRFKLYNSTKELIDTFNTSNNGSGSYLYNATFTGLTATTYYLNATHYNLANGSTNSTTLTFSTSIFNITFHDEILDTKIIGERITINVVGDDYAQNYSTNTSNVGVVGWSLGSYRLTYDSDKYGKRTYYHSLLNSTNSSLTLYLLSDGNGTDVTFTVQDNSGNSLQNATIRLKRYYVSTNSYRIIAMSRTNEEGKTLIDVDFNDAYYEILVTYKEFSLRTIGARIISLTRILTLNLIPSPFDITDAIAGVTTSLAFNNVTQTFSYVFTDMNGISRIGTLEVYKSTVTTSELVCTSTDTTSSGTLLCVVNTTNIPGTYTAKGFISVNPKLLTNTLQIFTGTVTKFKAIWGSQGIFFTILIAGTLGGLGAAISPAVGIIMFLVGITIASFLGMSIISMVFLAFLILAAAIIIFKMKR